MKPESEYAQRARFYNSWKRTPEAARYRPPEQYIFLVTYQNNFKAVREAFNLAWITHRLTS